MGSRFTHRRGHPAARVHGLQHTVVLVIPVTADGARGTCAYIEAVSDKHGRPDRVYEGVTRKALTPPDQQFISTDIERSFGPTHLCTCPHHSWPPRGRQRQAQQAKRCTCCCLSHEVSLADGRQATGSRKKTSWRQHLRVVHSAVVKPEEGVPATSCRRSSV